MPKHQMPDGRIQVRFRVVTIKGEGKYIRRIFPDIRGKGKLAQKFEANWKEQWNNRLACMDARTNGMWLVVLPPNEHFPEQFVREFGYDYEAAKEYGRQAVIERKHGTWIDPDSVVAFSGPLTLASLWLSYLEFAKSSLEKSTLRRYVQLWDKHLAEDWRGLVVRDVRRIHIQDWVNKKQKKTSVATTEKAFQVLRILFNFAVETDVIQFSPADKGRIKFEERETRKAPPMTLQQCKDVVANITRYSDKLAVMTGYITVMREGEFLALQVSDFDYESRTLTVNRIVDNIDGGTKRGHKTGNKPKVVAVSKAHAERLRAYISDDALGDSDLLFPSPSGKLWNLDNFRNRVWYPAIESAGIERIRSMTGLHHLRRTAITHAKNSGLSSLEVAAQSKHSDIGVLERSYYLVEEGDASKVAQYLGDNLETGDAFLVLERAASPN